MAKYAFLIISFLTLISCKDKYDTIKRYPEYQELEKIMKRELMCDDAIIQSTENEGRHKLTLIFINSEKVKLKYSEKEKKEWCYSIAYKFYNNLVIKPATLEEMEVIFVEKINFIIQKSEYYGVSLPVSQIEKMRPKKSN